MRPIRQTARTGYQATKVTQEKRKELRGSWRRKKEKRILFD